MPRPRCVVLDGSTLTEHVPESAAHTDEPSWKRLASLVDLVVFPRSSPEERFARIRGAELVLTNKVVVDRPLLEASTDLRYVGVLATGVNVVDLAAAKDRGVIVTNAPGYAAESVVAHVFGLILELEMRVAEHARAVVGGQWSRSPDFTFRLGSTLELAGRTLGIVGFGSIGQRVAEVGRAFGMRILAATRSTPDSARYPNVEFCSVDTLFCSSDVISLHCPLTPETERLVNRSRLDAMKPDAILINTGRGTLIDEPALAEALHRGRIRGAGLDVLSTEPPPADHPLLNAPRCLVTPHLAWASTAARQRLMDIVTDNVADYLAHVPTNRIVG